MKDKIHYESEMRLLLHIIQKMKETMQKKKEAVEVFMSFNIVVATNKCIYVIKIL